MYIATDGNLALLGSRVKQDAHVIKKLRDAGVIILGHANESEDADHRAGQYHNFISEPRLIVS